MNTLNSIAQIIKALSDPNRIRIIMIIGKKELCVCHLISILNLSPATVSEHLLILKKAEILDSRKEGKWIYYSRVDKSPIYITKIIGSLSGPLSTDTIILNDRKRLKKLLKESAQLCQK